MSEIQKCPKGRRGGEGSTLIGTLSQIFSIFYFGVRMQNWPYSVDIFWFRLFVNFLLDLGFFWLLLVLGVGCHHCMWHTAWVPKAQRTQSRHEGIWPIIWRILLLRQQKLKTIIGNGWLWFNTNSSVGDWPKQELEILVSVLWSNFCGGCMGLPAN